MCFSATADIAAGLLITGVGIDAVRHISRPSQIPLAALPLVLAAHQFTEAVLWWGLQGHVSATAQSVAMWLYLAVAFVLLPVYVPIAVSLIEPDRRRRTAMAALALVGAVVALDLGAAMARGPVWATLCPWHISYGIEVSQGWLVVAAYVAVTCGAPLLASSIYLRIFGGLNLLAVLILGVLARDGFASLWCAWAALVSVTIALHLRRAQTPATTPVEPQPSRARSG